MKKTGRPTIPSESKAITLSISIKPETFNRLDKFISEHEINVSKSSVFEFALLEFLKKNSEK